MTKLYPTNFVCIAQTQGGITLTLGAPTVGATATNTTLTVPLGLTLTGAKFGFICGPG